MIFRLKEELSASTALTQNLKADLQRKEEDYAELKEKLADAKKQIEQVQKEVSYLKSCVVNLNDNHCFPYISCLDTNFSIDLVKHRTTTKSEPFSLISTPPPAMLGAVDWMVPPPQKDVLKHDTCEHDLIWIQGHCRCNQVQMRSHWSKVTLKPVRPMSL